MQDGQQNEPGWTFRPNDGSQDTELSQETTLQTSATNETTQPITKTPSQEQAGSTDDLPHISWTASEYADHPKTGGWFLLLGLGSAILAAIVYLITKDAISTGIVIVLGILFGVFAARQPRVLQYAIDHTGIHIDQKFYAYQSFKSFSVVHDQAIGYISLMPLRRFMPPITIHYDPEDEEKIANTLAEYLPYEDHKPDVVDRLSRKIRF